MQRQSIKRSQTIHLRAVADVTKMGIHDLDQLRKDGNRMDKFDAERDLTGVRTFSALFLKGGDAHDTDKKPTFDGAVKHILSPDPQPGDDAKLPELRPTSMRTRRKVLKRTCADPENRKRRLAPGQVLTDDELAKLSALGSNPFPSDSDRSPLDAQAVAGRERVLAHRERQTQERLLELAQIRAAAITRGAALAEEYLAKRPEFRTEEMKEAHRRARAEHVADLDRRAERRRRRAERLAAEEPPPLPERRRGRAPLYPGPLPRIPRPPLGATQ